MDEFEYKEEYLYLTNIMLNVTDACNLACRYCFVELHPHYMTLETALAVADWTYLNLEKKINIFPNYKKECALNFFGGEPTLCYESIIVPLVAYCLKKYPNIFKFSITTNGTLLTKEKIDFFKKNNFGILLSIDGAPETLNYNRPCQNGKNSFELLELNISYLLQNFPNVTFRSTGYAPTINHLFENYLYAESLGFKSYIIVFDVRHEWTKELIEIANNELNKIYFYRLQQISNCITPMDFSEADKYLKYCVELNYNDSNFFNKEEYLSVYRCGLAITLGAIGWDGSIYGCQELVSKNNKNIFYLGNIFEKGIEQKLHILLLQFYYNTVRDKKLQKKECNNCSLLKICLVNKFSCPSSTYDIYDNMSELTPILCEILQNYYNNSFLLLLLASENENSNLKKYIEKIIIKN